MKFDWHFHPRTWELGIGFYLGHWYHCGITGAKSFMPTELSFLLGPWSACLTWGHKTEVIE